MAEQPAVFADVTRVKQAGKGCYMHVVVAGKGIWTRISKDTYAVVKEQLKTKGKEPKDAKEVAVA